MQASPTRNHPALPLMLLMFVIPLVLMLLYFRVADLSLRLLGLSPIWAALLLLGSVVGSTINIPITRRRVPLADPRLAGMAPAARMFFSMVHYYPPAVVEQVVAVNVGGALIPIAFSVYLLTLPTTPLLLAGLAALIVTVVAKLLARPVPGLGIALPGFIPPLLAAVTAVALVTYLGAPGGAGQAAPVAYVAGTLGTLIGADLLNLPLVLRGGLLAAGPQRLWILRRGVEKTPATQPRILSIGGAGLFDGIFLTGIVAPFLVNLAGR